MQTEKTSAPPRARRRVAGPVVPHSPRWFQWLAAALVWVCVRLLAATIRFRWHDSSRFFCQNTPPAIYCVWHNRLALCLPIYYRFARRFSGTPGMAAMVSASKDGALLAAILRCFRVAPVRGSSSRRGPQALLELTSWRDQGYDLAITPDGPRGPCYEVQEGIMALAQVTGLPILPVSYYLAWKIRAGSWDRFQIPLPFSRCEVFLQPPIRVPRDASDSEREALRLHLQNVLKEVSRD
jgi:lysophospholipid acyltransferase (LPLAT)-like uncharacterized protein